MVAGGGYLLNNLQCKIKNGFDVNKDALRTAKAAGIECFKDLKDIQESSIDVVISNSCLEHVPNPLMSLKELSTKIKPGGRIVISIPHETIDYAFSGSPDWNYHLYTWSPSAIGNLLIEAGFENVKSDKRKGVQIPKSELFESIFGYKIVSVFSKIYRILRLIISEFGMKTLSIDGNILATGIKK